MITLVKDTGGDWIGVYRDGILLAQDHSIGAERMLKLLDVDFESREMFIEGKLPENLSEVVG